MASQVRAPFTWLASTLEIRMLICVALAATAPGTRQPDQALDLRRQTRPAEIHPSARPRDAPHHKRPACRKPRHEYAPRRRPAPAVLASPRPNPSTATSITRFNSVGAKAEKMKRPPRVQDP